MPATKTFDVPNGRSPDPRLPPQAPSAAGGGGYAAIAAKRASLGGPPNAGRIGPPPPPAVPGNRVRRNGAPIVARADAVSGVGPSAARLGVHDNRRRAEEKRRLLEERRLEEEACARIQAEHQAKEERLLLEEAMKGVAKAKEARKAKKKEGAPSVEDVRFAANPYARSCLQSHVEMSSELAAVSLPAGVRQHRCKVGPQVC